MRTRRAAVRAAASALILALAASSAPAAVRGATRAPGAAPAAEPAPLHDLVFLSPATFEVVESGGAAAITILRTGHGTVRGTVDYSTTDGTAQAGSDYQSKTGTVSLQAPDDATEVLVNVTNDAEVEAPETINVALANPAGAPGMILRFPFTGTITIIDDDGPARFSLSTSTYSNFENRLSMDITIVRSGDASGTSTVSYSTADGTAVGGDDYTAVPPTTVEFAPGERFKRQSVPLINDSVEEGPEQFSVALSDPSGAVLTEPSTATVEILDDDSGSSDKTPPVTNFHRPLNGKKYKTTSPYAKELHVSPGDEGSGLDKVELALLMKRRDGKCAWYRGSGFRSGGCLTKKWVKIPTRLFIVYRLKKRLKPATRKTGIKNYTAYARATDNAGNVERLFEAGRNKMRYRIVP